jgi:hypothetical protein
MFRCLRKEVWDENGKRRRKNYYSVWLEKLLCKETTLEMQAHMGV